MSLDQLPFNWFDFVLVIVLLVGAQRGRKRGMSEELLTLLRWVALALACAFLYQPVGQMIVGSSGVFDLLSSYVIAYLGLALVVAIVFSLFKRAVGGKLIGSNLFGRGEYYLAMPAGMVRCVCILLAFLALLNARYFSPQEVKRYDVATKDLYGSDYFPTLHAAQSAVFEKSLTGPWIRTNLACLLIKPTPYHKSELKRKEPDLPQ
jgi:uncharacterized membrane protein required for colicin V production